jgi:glyoxylate reductase
LRQLADAVGLITLLTERVDEELFLAAPELEVVANFAVGYDNVDIVGATRRKILVANTPDVLTEATADFTFALLLALVRRVVEGDALVRSGNWAGWAPDQLLGADVSGRTLGLVGFGRIGRAVARRGRGFGMRILYSSPSAADGASELGARRVAFEELLAEADFLSLHCPLTPATRNLIDGRALARIKPGAFLINTARGGCVDEQAVADALKHGRLGGAALDVFSAEPAIEPAFLTCSRVLLAPHAASATNATRRRMAELCATAVRKVLDGVRPENAVNPEVMMR